MKTITKKYQQIPSSGDGFSIPPPFFQPKLTINNPDDKYEREADTMADKIMGMEQPGIQLQSLPITTVQRKCTDCEEEENKLQRKENNKEETTADNSLESYVGNLGGGGQPLPKEVRNFYEPRFGYDFSNVKIHTDTVAAKSAQSINALAYTTGNNIVFNNGQFDTGSNSGKKILGHELTHVVQQGGNVIRRYGHDKHCDQATRLEPFIWPGHAKALSMLDNIASAFQSGDAKINQWAPVFFGKDALSNLGDIQAKFESIRTAIRQDYMYHCNDSSNKNSDAKTCKGQRAETDLDKHYWGGGNKDITLCFDVINSSWSVDDVASLIIHENFHRAFGASNHPYGLNDPKGGGPPDCGQFVLSPPKANLLLDNPDSYGCMARMF